MCLGFGFLASFSVEAFDLDTCKTVCGFCAFYKIESKTADIIACLFIHVQKVRRKYVVFIKKNYLTACKSKKSNKLQNDTKKTLNDSGVQIKEAKPETKLPDSRLDSCPLLI